MKWWDWKWNEGPAPSSGSTDAKKKTILTNSSQNCPIPWPAPSAWKSARRRRNPNAAEPSHFLYDTDFKNVHHFKGWLIIISKIPTNRQENEISIGHGKCMYTDTLRKELSVESGGRGVTRGAAGSEAWGSPLLGRLGGARGRDGPARVHAAVLVLGLFLRRL